MALVGMLQSAWLVPRPLGAQIIPEADLDVQAAIRQVNEGNFADAIPALENAVVRPATDAEDVSDRWQAYLYLGIAYLGLGYEPAAVKTYFRWALSLKPDLTLSTDTFPRQVVDLFETVREEDRAAAAAASAAATAVRTHEHAGLEAENAGRLRQAFMAYVAALHALPDPPPTEDDRRIRERVIRLVTRMDPRPRVPDQAKRLASQGTAALQEARDQAGFSRAASQLRAATRMAPWWAPLTYNLGLVEEKTTGPAAAMAGLELYLLAEPQTPKAEQVRARLRDLQAQVGGRATGAVVSFLFTHLVGIRVDGGVATLFYNFKDSVWDTMIGLRSGDRVTFHVESRHIVSLQPQHPDVETRVHQYRNARAACESEARRDPYAAGDCSRLMIVACEAGHPRACDVLANAYRDGNLRTYEWPDELPFVVLTPDPQRSASFREKACAAGLMDVCLVLGGDYERGRGVLQDSARAAELYRRACEAGLDNGCHALRQMGR